MFTKQPPATPASTGVSPPPQMTGKTAHPKKRKKAAGAPAKSVPGSALYGRKAAGAPDNDGGMGC